MSSPTPEPLIQAVDLTVRLGGRPVLEGVSLAVSRGDFVGVIGPNGAGKSTLMRTLLGMHRPERGAIRLQGKPLESRGLRERARIVSYLGQEPPDIFPFPVLEVVLMGRYPHLGRFERESREDRERALRALAYVGLGGLESRYFTELSGGERQLVLFARVLAQEAEILVLDEPTANLDIRHQDLFFSMAWELAREGKGVLVSLHNLNVAAQYCGRIALLDRGALVADDTPAAVLQPRILDAVYGASTVVSANPVTGSLTVAVLPRERRSPSKGRHIHLIGGAGSAVNMTRELARLGCVLTGGVTHEYDADEALWRALGIKRVTVGAFSRIQPSDTAVAEPHVDAADAVILTSFPVGPGNLENLRLASRARRLVILEPGPGDPDRSFFSDEAAALFQTLRPLGRAMTYRQVVVELESGAFWGSGT